MKAELCRRSFYYFVKEFWSTIIEEQPVWNWHIEFLCGELQKIAERVKNREPFEYPYYIINIPPGSSKSTLCSQMYIAWVWTIDPTQRFICGSYSQTIARKDATFTQQIINSDKYQRYFPSVKLTKDAVDLMRNTNNGERYATSTGSGITGVHAHTIIIDDPLNPKEASSEVERQSAIDWITQTLPTRKVDKKVTPTILVMQRLHESDPSGYILTSGLKCKHICLPAEVSELCTHPDKYTDGLLDPVRLDRDILDEMRKTLGSYGYSGQFEQRPAPAEGGIIKKSFFQIIEPQHAPRATVNFFLDPAYGGEDSNYSAIIAFSVVMGNLYILDAKQVRYEFPELLRFIPEFANKNGYNPASIIYCEPKACFVKGTLVRTMNGLKPIEDVKNGDYVLSLNIEKQKGEYKKVINTSTNVLVKQKKIFITFVLNNGIVIKTTDNHEFYIERNWYTARGIAKRVMEMGCEYESEISDINLWENSNDWVEGDKSDKGNETCNRRKWLPENSTKFYNKEKENNKTSQNCCTNIFRKSNELSSSESQKFNQDRQQIREFGMVHSSNEHDPYGKTGKGCWICERSETKKSSCWFKESCSNSKRRHCERNKAKICSKKSHRKNVSGRIQIKSEYDNLHTIHWLEISKVIISEEYTTTYDLEVEDNHNFCITEKNIVVHNSGKSIVQTLKKTTNLNIKEDVSPTKDKVARVQDVIAPIEAGRCCLVRGGWNTEFIDQCAVFPNGKQDGYVDCLSASGRMAFLKSGLKFF